MLVMEERTLCSVTVDRQALLTSSMCAGKSMVTGWENEARLAQQQLGQALQSELYGNPTSLAALCLQSELLSV